MFKLRAYHKYMSYFYLYLVGSGLALILFGILFIVMPELLAYLVSFFFILLGVMSLVFAMRVKATERRVRKKINEMSSRAQGKWDDFRDIWDGW